jgi:hypothetical protein
MRFGGMLHCTLNSVGPTVRESASVMCYRRRPFALSAGCIRPHSQRLHGQLQGSEAQVLTTAFRRSKHPGLMIT